MKTHFVFCKTCGEKVPVEKEVLPGARIVFYSKVGKIKFDTDTSSISDSEKFTYDTEKSVGNVLSFIHKKSRSSEIENELANVIFELPSSFTKEYEKIGIYLTCEDNHEHKYYVYM
ncbi:MAG: hypothetical protein AAFZ89_01845 [Bacteroidota bacterium]